jgi:hypothetical protein
MKLITRAQWGAARPKGRDRLAAETVHGVAIHYSGMNSDEQANHRNCPGRVRAMQRYHMEHNGWLDVAYTHLLCVHGFVFEGRGFGIRTAANGTTAANDHYLAICFLGDDTKGRRDVTPAARAALAELLDLYRRRYGAKLRIRPHSDFFPTECPGDELRRLIKRP